MKINEHTALLTPHLLLVPYSPHHVPTYHEWMQDEDLLTQTASLPLSLAAEHEMQASWRSDGDKLTFIICEAPQVPSLPQQVQSQQRSKITPEVDDAPERMIGDVNLFLSPADSSDDDEGGDGNGGEEVVAELEIMIASPSHRGRGLALECLLAFIAYLRRNLSSILAEANGRVKLAYLRVKIDQHNLRSVRLFERLGFEREGAGANYFGEVELRRRLGSEDGEGDVGVEVGYGL
ncbi:acyl-CoA N-acyltransferase [Dothidotthia symphoricarpi CBS 119687]|uniref:Acyl-CoA N-acyltransferase n=1 Tax=Dothidotthia symphoricarpi CBS 119687 TaxID=1392245 RepID=A0A6A6AUB3_9PLEO|nr:acyl-CoA N-acyltransferase [Dothidotthia symphoricarpi CBS 119687]KAF2134121.1 acyl-CoA N-acyltransferase [Dothidotthia symphoricarpi CBS 119687]